MTLTTKRLTLRPFREDDVEALYAYSKDEAVGLGAGWKPHESLLESSDILHLVSSTSRPSGRSSERPTDA